MFKRSKSIVGLDVGASAVKAVELTLEGAEPVVTGFGAAPISADQGVEGAIDQALACLRGKTRNCVTGMGGQATVVRYISMLPMTREELRQAVTFEADKYLPFDADEVVLDCEPLQGDAEGERVPVLVAACRRRAIEERVALLDKAGLLPQAIDLDLFALANAWELCGIEDELEPEATEAVVPHAIALIDVGATRTSINVLRAGETCFSREMGIGGDDMTQAVARRTGLELGEAELLKCDPGDQEADVSGAVAPILEDLASEIALSIDYVEHHEGVEVRELLLSGGAVQAAGTVAAVEQATGRSARLWNPLEGLRVEPDLVDLDALEAWSSSLVVAMGLASRVRHK